MPRHVLDGTHFRIPDKASKGLDNFRFPAAWAALYQEYAKRASVQIEKSLPLIAVETLRKSESSLCSAIPIELDFVTCNEVVMLL